MPIMEYRTFALGTFRFIDMEPSTNDNREVSSSDNTPVTVRVLLALCLLKSPYFGKSMRNVQYHVI